MGSPAGGMIPNRFKDICSSLHGGVRLRSIRLPARQSGRCGRSENSERSGHGQSQQDRVTPDRRVRERSSELLSRCRAGLKRLRDHPADGQQFARAYDSSGSDTRQRRQLVGPRQTIELPIQGMDCADCARRVEDTIAGISGVRSVNVLLAAEKAIVELDPTRADPALIRAAVESIGYRVPVAIAPASRTLPFRDFAGSVFTILGIAFGAI